MAVEFDLLGDPIPANAGKPGRNEHAPSAEVARKIRVLLIARLPLKRIAEEIGLSVPTMRKHYFASGRVNERHARDMARAEQNAKVLLQLDQAAGAGNVAAMKEMRKVLADEARRDLPPGKKPTSEAKGKKEQLRDRAKQPAGSWGDIGLPGGQPGKPH